MLLILLLTSKNPASSSFFTGIEALKLFSVMRVLTQRHTQIRWHIFDNDGVAAVQC